jgi:DNA-binding NarL/FixJ family response regulator
MAEHQPTKADRMIRLVVADDHPIVREGLKRLIESDPDIQLVGEAVDGHDAVRQAKELCPDVLLLDVSMPGPHFLEILSQLRSTSGRGSCWSRAATSRSCKPMTERTRCSDTSLASSSVAL